jgi:D-alanyl-lipoteichoic acid acyltransferase DltB (MBOAT superfamily)
MLFNSLQFAVFFPVVTVLYFALPQRLRWLHLLIASCIFYMAFIPAYVLILAFTIVVDYFAGILIERSRGAARRAMLLASLAANIGVLAVFKYLAFLADGLLALLHLGGFHASFPALHIILPIGLSFHTFQAMSYTIEVYRGKQPAERHFGIYALYVMFYPQLVAGPIERPQILLHQFREHHAFDYGRVTDGLKLMAMGLFKKIVIADQLAPAVNRTFEHLDQHHGLALVIAVVSFAFQIYYDFCGYSEIAIGSAQVMGFRLMTNFDAPYFSRSVTEFWRRWHISLSTWFRDYVYYPLGGSRVSTPRWCLNIMIVFLVSGLWHGASWTFVAWGAIHGVLLIVENLPQRLLGPGLAAPSRTWWRDALAIVRTFVLVCVAWVFFRAATFSDAWYVLSSACRDLPYDLHLLLSGRCPAGIQPAATVLMALAVAGTLLVEYLNRSQPIWTRIAVWPAACRLAVYSLLVYTTLFSACYHTENQFIYFQF